jgi:hypothetical protein
LREGISVAELDRAEASEDSVIAAMAHGTAEAAA